MNRQALLTIAFSDYWLAGTGAARGHEADAIADRDRNGLPVMRMSQIKGQLRETAARLAQSGAGGWTPERVMELLGDEDNHEAAIAFDGDAALDPDSRALLCADDAAKTLLFRSISSTKINKLGVAEDLTLRSIEVVVPLTLFGVLESKSAAPDGNWIDLLDLACAATLAFGKLKSDGYGRAVASLEALP